MVDGEGKVDSDNDKELDKSALDLTCSLIIRPYSRRDLELTHRTVFKTLSLRVKTCMTMLTYIISIKRELSISRLFCRKLFTH